MKRKLISQIVSIGLIFSVIGAVFSGLAKPVHAESTIYVPDGYPTIQAAVDAASPGDTIIVRSGNYTENIDVNKMLTIQSENGSATTIVQADNASDHVFEITADNVTINGFTIQGSGGYHYAGIYVTGSSNRVFGNRVQDNPYDGIHITGSQNAIYDNKVSGSQEAISLYYADNNSVSGNDVTESIHGITLGASNHNSITNNHLKTIEVGGGIGEGVQVSFNSCSNGIRGNIIEASGNGIELFDESNENTLLSNVISNSLNGIVVHTQNCTIRDNNVRNSKYYGIYLDASGNTIYLDNFIDNADNVYSENSNNSWDSPEEITYTYNGTTYRNHLGNYWSDYTGTDNNSDGIGDTPYEIAGDAGARDNYPLMEPFQNYEKVWTFMTYLGMNDYGPPPDLYHRVSFRDPRVRMAVYLSLDRDGLQGLVQNVHTQNVEKVTSIVTPAVPNPSVNRSKDIELARQLLWEAGYPDNFQTILHVPVGLDWLAEKIAGDLAGAGIEVTVRIMDRSTLYKELQDRTVEFFLVDTTVNWKDTPELLGRLLLSAGPENFTGYSSATFDELFSSGSFAKAEDTAFTLGSLVIAPLLWHEASLYQGDGIIHGTVSLQGGERPENGHDVDLSVKLFTLGADVWSGTPTANYTYVPGGGNNTITNVSANITTHIVSFDIVGMAPGTYDITISSNHTLMNVKRTVNVQQAEINVNFVILLEGNCNNDRQVNADDFSTLAGTYLKSTGDPGWDASADFDESGQINALDFSLLAASYLMYRAPVELG